MSGLLGLHVRIVAPVLGTGPHPERSGGDVGPIRIVPDWPRRWRVVLAQQAQHLIAQGDGLMPQSRIGCGEEIERPHRRCDPHRVFRLFRDQRQQQLRDPQQRGSAILADPAQTALQDVEPRFPLPHPGQQLPGVVVQCGGQPGQGGERRLGLSPGDRFEKRPALEIAVGPGGDRQGQQHEDRRSDRAPDDSSPPVEPAPLAAGLPPAAPFVVPEQSVGMTLDTRVMVSQDLGTLRHLARSEELALQRHEAPQTEKLGIDAEAGVGPSVVDQADDHLGHAVVGEHIDLLVAAALEEHYSSLGRRQPLQDALAVVADAPRQVRGLPALAAPPLGVGELAQSQKRPGASELCFRRLARGKGDVERAPQVLLERPVDQLARILRHLDDADAVVVGDMGRLEQMGEHHLELRRQGRVAARGPGLAEGAGEARC